MGVQVVCVCTFVHTPVGIFGGMCVHVCGVCTGGVCARVEHVQVYREKEAMRISLTTIRHHVAPITIATAIEWKIKDN